MPRLPLLPRPRDFACAIALAVLAPSAPPVAARPAAGRAPAAGDTLAWVGSRAITAGELERRLQAVPWPAPARGADADSVPLRALESLVAEKLLAQEAERRHTGLGGGVAGMRAALVRALARDALYRREVAGDTTRAAAVLNRVLSGRRAAVDPPTFHLLSDALRARMEATRAEREGPGGRLRILAEDVDFLRARLSGDLARALVRLPDGALTLEDVVEDLRFYEFTVRSLEPQAFDRAFNGHLKVVVERDLLAGEAIRQHLDRLPEVRDELATWTDAWRANALAQTVGPPAALDPYLASLARRMRVRLDARRALALELPEQKMLVRRLLGFGGGMLAAPGLAPRWGWAPLWRSAAPALP